MGLLRRWGMFALLVAIIALSFPPREHTKKEYQGDQVMLGAPTMMPAFARTIHIQKNTPLNADVVPLTQSKLQEPSLRKGDIAYGDCLPVSLPVHANDRAAPPYSARESYKAVTGLHAPRNRVLLFWKVNGHSRTIALT